MARESTAKVAIEVAQMCRDLRRSKYEPDIHLPMLYELFKEGYSISSFCSKAKICKTTFTNWVNKYEDFGMMYAIAKECAQDFWERWGRVHSLLPEFNFMFWSMTMRNRFNYTEHRKIRIKALENCHTIKEQFNAVLNLLKDGDATPTEANHLANFILTGIKVEELTQIMNKLEELEGKVNEQTPKKTN